MPTPIFDIRPKSADSAGPISNPTPPTAAKMVAKAPQSKDEGRMRFLWNESRKKATFVLPVLPILIAVAWAYAAGKLPGSATDAPKAEPPAKPALAVELVADKPNSLLVPEDVRKSLGIYKAGADQIAVAELPTRKRPLVMPGSTALDPARLIRVRVRFAPAEVVEIGKIVDPHASPGIVPPLRRDLQAGDPVKKGDLLAVLFSVDLGNKKNDLFDALSQLRFDQEVLKRAEDYKAAVPEVFLLNAKRNVQADINAVSRAENTLKTWAIPEEEIQAVRDEVKNYTSDQERRAREKGPLKQWARVELKAPVDGFVIEQNVALHETVVDNTTNLFQIAKVDPLIVLAAVPEDDLPALAVGVETRHVGQADVKVHGVGRLAVDHFESVAGSAGRDDFEPGRAQDLSQRVAHVRFVVDDQEALHDCTSSRFPGSRTVKIAPPAGPLAAVIRPPCASTMRRQMANPSPRPVSFVLT